MALLKAFHYIKFFRRCIIFDMHGGGLVVVDGIGVLEEEEKRSFE